MTSLSNNTISQVCRWHSFDDTEKLEQAVIAGILRAAQAAIAQRGAFHIVLAGGNTPREVYQTLRYATATWDSWHIYFGDERCLPSDHAERNSHMAASAWLDHVAIPKSQIHVIPAEEGATVAAEKYAQIINGIGTFDLVLLGLGEDGHTASLFPDHEWGMSDNSPAMLAIEDAPKPPPRRVSLSARRLSDTHQVLFLVTGQNKRQAVNNWRTGNLIPASVITTQEGVDIYIENALLS